METMEAQEKHQGYRNYETFVVGSWIENDQQLRDQMRALVKEAAQGQEIPDAHAAGALRDHYDQQMPELDSPWDSLLGAGFGEVDWLEIARDLLFPEGDGFYVFKDGLERSGPFPTYLAAMGDLHRIFGAGSADHAMKYEGYAIEVRRIK